MTKYIYIILLVGVCSLRLDAQHPIGEAKIDSIYHTLSLEEKVRSLLVRPMIEPWTEEPDSIPKWVNMEKLLISEGKRPLMLSDMMIRSALLRGNNRDVRDRFMNLLLRKRLDGAYFPMQSPYTLLFQDVDSQPIDLFLNPIGRLVVPYVDEGAGNRVFMTNLYKLPKDILSQQQLLLKERSLSSSTQHFIKGAGWRGVADVKGLSEEPTLDMLLKHGGLIYSDDAEKDFKILLRVFENRVLPQQLLEQSCKKRLLLESLLSHKPKPMVYGALNEEIDNLVRQLYQKGAVLLENKGVLPLRELEKRSVVSIHIGTDKESVFQQTLSKYCSVNHYDIEGVPDVAHVAKLRKSIAGFNTVIVGVNGDWFEDDMNASLYSFLHQISSSAELILVHFGSGNRLKDLPIGHPFKAILLSYDMNSTAQEIAAQIIFGGVGAQGILARNIDKRFAFGCGELTHKSRLGFAPSYSVAMSDTLKLIDQEVYKAIRERAIPGCQVLVAKDGDVIYNKAFGYHTYNKKRHVETSDLYDIASVTKIVSSIPAIMKMYDEGRIELDDSLSHLIPRLKGSNKAGLKLDDIMIHQAGLQSWIPFYLRAIDKERLKGDIYSRRYSSLYNIKVDKSLYMNRTVRYRTDVFRHSSNDDFNIQVSAGLYMNKGYLDSMRMGIDTSQVQANPTYRYSDLGYYYLKEIIENKYNKSQDVVVENTFYKPLGAERLMYLPLRKFNKREIVPTENDVSFRKELIHGYVHDPGAAMLGGVGGHAGVFASAEDLAKMLQMYLNNGYYGGERYIDSSTINIFTSVVKEGNRRGLGFDKPVLDPKVSGPTCREVSPSSYGHSGFTGTLVWMDPEYDLMYIFLSNRIHPNQYNKKLISGDVRTNIQSAIYRSLPEYWEKTKRK